MPPALESSSWGDRALPLWIRTTLGLIRTATIHWVFTLCQAQARAFYTYQPVDPQSNAKGGSSDSDFADEKAGAHLLCSERFVLTSQPLGLNFWSRKGLAPPFY